MINAERIVRVLDAQLDHPVTLVVYGRAAIALGFHNPPADVSQSLDVDIILSRKQVPELEKDEQFWTALDNTNRLIEKDGLYVTHLFSEEQVFLRPVWEREIIPLLRPPLQRLDLYRPATIDLMLTKMMRGADPIDRADLEFLIRYDRLTVAQIERAIAEAVIPELPELKTLFNQARPIVIELARGNVKSD